MTAEYAKLTIPQKWQWHAEVYALRRVMLEVAHAEHTSPCDPQGEWFDERLIAVAEQRYRTRLREMSERCKASTRDANAIRFADAERWRNSEQGREFLLGTRPKRQSVRPQDYGVTAWEPHEPRTAE